MRRACLATLALLSCAAWARDGRFERTNSRTPQGRSERGFLGDSYAFFEAFPASGAGAGAACACTTPTGAKGEALTFTRASNGTCTKTATGGLATSGIANGDLVVCSSNQPRTEYDGAGTLGLLVESARSNVLLRSDALTNAAWADVGTPNATDGATDPFGGTTGDTLTDNDAVAFEGRSQAVTVTAATAYIMSCYLKGTTSAKARLSLDGTTCDVSTLATTTWNLVKCADASSSGVSISAQVLVGNAVGDTGDIVVGGCQVEAGTYATSYSRTDAAAANRVVDAMTVDLGVAAPGGGKMSLAVTLTGKPSAVDFNSYASAISAASDSMGSGTGKGMWLYSNATSGATMRCLSSNESGVSFVTGSSGASSGTVRGWCAANGTLTGEWPSGSALSPSGAMSGTFSPARYLTIAGMSLGAVDAIKSRVCIDPSPTRCR